MKPVILDGTRTPFGSFGGSLKDHSAVELGEIVSRDLFARLDINPAETGEVIFGNVIQSSKDAVYLARHVALRSGLPVNIPALTVNRLCGSGLESVIQACRQIALGENELILTGGTESMSQAPYIVRDGRWGAKYGNTEFEDSLTTGLTDQYTGLPMGMTAENLADIYKISRTEQDEWAAISQERAEKARDSVFSEEITPVILKDRSKTTFSKDEFIRGASSREKLPALKPVFKKDGTVTAGNASGINDGASAILVASEKYAKNRGIDPLASIIAYSHTGCDPATMGIGPAVAIPIALKKAGLKLEDIGLVEINEAFAAQYLAVQKELNLRPEITNVNGGAIAIGHPLGASGSRITLSLAREMQRRGVRYGIASLCIGGGQGIAVILENPRA